MKKRISYVIFLVSLLTLTVLCGCDKSTKSAQEKQEKTENQEQVTKEETDRKKNNTINLYYLNAQEDGFKKVSCKLQHSDDLKEINDECWLDKKHSARRMSEAVQNRLYIPTMLMFIGILVVIIVPAMAGFNL